MDDTVSKAWKKSNLLDNPHLDIDGINSRLNRIINYYKKNDDAIGKKAIHERGFGTFDNKEIIDMISEYFKLYKVISDDEKVEFNDAYKSGFKEALRGFRFYFINSVKNHDRHYNSQDPLHVRSGD